LLDRFNVKIDEIPIVICSRKAVQRNPTTQQLAQCLGLSGKVDESHILYAPKPLVEPVLLIRTFPRGFSGGLISLTGVALKIIADEHKHNV
jgi:hypothetical protein